MAAPSGTVWGSIVGDYGRVGIHVALTHTATTTRRVVTLWFWSKYSVSDSTNTLYYDAGTTSATSSKGSVSISTSVSSGTGWSTSNQVKLKTYDHTYSRGTSNWSESCAMKLSGIDRVGGTMTATTSYTVPKLDSYTVSYNANGGTGAPGAQTKYYGKNITLSATKPTRTGYTFQGWATSATGAVAYQPGATYSANAGITLYAKWVAITYAVYYNGNGGTTNIPSAQTKTYGVNLTLSSTRPTRTGYTFLGWATSSTGGVAYQPGSAYTTNAAVTLYAKWQIITYSITYDPNGGTGAPGAQTKNYGSTLTLSTVKPTRTNYDFLGWSTNKNATSATYSAGGSYTANASATLYAVWKLAYTKPRISNVSITRCDADGNLSDTGTFALLTFSYATDLQPHNPTISYVYNGETKTQNLMIVVIEDPVTGEQIYNTKDTFENIVIGTAVEGGPFSLETTHTINISVSDGDGETANTTTLPVTLPAMTLTLDLYAGGKGIAFGKPASKEGFECDFDAYFNKPLTSTTLLGQNVGGYDSSKIIIFPEISYSTLNSLYGTTGTDDNVYFKNLLRWICANYPSKQHYIFIGKVNPNSTGIGIISIYDTNTKDATTGLPQYSSGLYIRLGTTPFYFGASSYTYYSSAVAASSHTHTIANITNLQTTLDGKAATHSHPYLPTAGGTITGNLTINGHTYNKGHVYFCGTTYYCSSAGHVYCNTGHVRSGSLQIGTAGIDNSHALLMTQFNLGTDNASDGNRYYINNKATGRFNALRYTTSKAISSRRFKNNIDYKDVDYWHDALMQIKPCTFFYNNDDKTKHIGLIAEDLYDLIPELVGLDDEEKTENEQTNVKPLPSAIEYANLTVPIIGELQLLNNRLEEQDKRISEQDEIIEEQRIKMAEHELRIASLETLVQQLLSK